jgi:hypothetical protein
VSASPQSWERLQTELADLGIEARLDERAYSQTHYGRIEHGVSRSLFIRLDGGGSIYVATQERYGTWSWTVGREDSEGIMVGKPVFGLKRRGDVVERVQAFVRQAAAA